MILIVILLTVTVAHTAVVLMIGTAPGASVTVSGDCKGMEKIKIHIINNMKITLLFHIAAHHETLIFSFQVSFLT